MYCEDDLNLLKLKVTEFLKTKLYDIKSPGDFAEIFNSKISKTIQLTNCENEFIMLKKIAQITLNLYHNFDIFKNIPINFTEDEVKLIPPGTVYSYEVNSQQWLGYCRPDNSFVINVLFNYILCFLSLKEAEDDVKKISYDDNAPVTRDCRFCDEVIDQGELCCKVCEASVEDMVIRSNNVVTNEGLVNGNENKFEYKENFEEDFEEKITELKKDSIKIFVFVEKNEKYFPEEEVSTELIDETKNYSFDDFNDIENEVKYNETWNPERKFIDGKKSVTEDRWKCSSCGLLNVYKSIVCDACLIPMDEAGLWICKACTYWNTFYDSKCAVCEVYNDHVVIRFCQFCKKRRIRLEERICRDCKLDNHFRTNNGWWECRFVYCRNWSKECENYCQYCGLWRHNLVSMMNSGGDVKMIKRGKEIIVWICFKCYTINSCDKKKCGNFFCQSKRFTKKPCSRCGMYSDGKSNICRKCHDII